MPGTSARLAQRFASSALFCALFGLTVAGTGCSSEWTAVRTKHFTLYTDSDFLYRPTLRSLEQGYAGLKARYFNAAEIGQVEVLFLDDVPFQELFGAYRTGAAVAKTPGSSKIGKEGLLVLRPNVLGAGSERAAEGTQAATDQLTQNAAGQAAIEMLAHIFIMRSMPNAPLWFHEGFANYARNMVFVEGGGKQAACFGLPPGIGQKEALLTSLGEMWGANFDKYDDEYKAWLPFTGRLFFDYVVHGQGGKYRDKLGPFVMKVYDGVPGPEALKASFGWSEDDMYTRLKEHRQQVAQEAESKASPRGKCPLPLEVPAEFAPDTSDPQRSPVDEAEIKTLIAGLEKLPRREGFPPFYPLEVCEAAASKK